MRAEASARVLIVVGSHTGSGGGAPSGSGDGIYSRRQPADGSGGGAPSGSGDGIYSRRQPADGSGGGAPSGPADGARLHDGLRAAGQQPTLARAAPEALAHLDEASFDVVLLDPTLPDDGSNEVWSRVRSEDLPTRVLLLTRAPSLVEQEMLAGGASGWVSPEVTEVELSLRVRQAAREADQCRQLQRLRARLAEPGEPVGGFVSVDPATRQVVAAADRAAASDLPALLEGEAGTGKTTLAQRIHAASARAGAPLVIVECRGRAEAEFEAALFGSGRTPGLAEAADGGVLLLRGVEALSPALQSRLLRLIEAHELFRARAARTIPVDVRVMSTCRGDLDAFVRSGRLQEGLFDRLDGFRLRLPPLRERRVDVAPLAAHFLAEASGGRKRFSAEALDRMRELPWAGNASELRLATLWAAARSPGETVEATDLPWPFGAGEEEDLPAGLSLRAALRAYIEAALQRNRGHRGRTARELGIDPKTLYNKLGAERPRKKAGVP